MNNRLTFCDENAHKIETEIIANYESLANKKLYPADPVRIFLQGLAYVIAHQRAVINETGRQNLLRYAKGVNLDALGELLGVSRIPASNATVTCRFTRVKGSSSAVLVRKGTRVTADSKIYFQAQEGGIIASGQEYADLQCVSMIGGTAGNAYKSGDINKIVDTVAYLSGVSNITDATGGADTEDDESLRGRIRIAPERFSVAGPVLAYKYHAMSVHPSLIDAAVISPVAGHVEIYPLLEGGGIPASELLADILKAVSADNVRPLTDFVSVLPPVEKRYNIAITYYLYDNVPVKESAITATVEEFVLWQKAKLGRDVNPDKLLSMLLSLGIKRTTISSPIFTALSNKEIAVCNGITLTFGGIEHE